MQTMIGKQFLLFAVLVVLLIRPQDSQASRAYLLDTAGRGDVGELYLIGALPDGINWSNGGRIAVQPEGEANWARDIRTALGLVDDGNGLFTLLHAACDKRGFRSVGMVKSKVAPKNNNMPATTAFIKQRGLVSQGDPARIQAVLAKARRGEPICVAAIGGSITAGGAHTKDPKRRYVQQVAKWFEQTFPGLKVRCVNAGIGGTNSVYGAARVPRDVIAHHPDLVVVEYAVNDSTGIAKLDESYEGVLRQLLTSSTKPAVMELFFMHKDGKSAQPEQVVLGRHYGLPMLSFRDAVWPELQAGKLKWETVYDDVVHPNDAGHDIASELLRGLLAASFKTLPKDDRDLPAISPVPAPLISDTYERCVLFRAADFKPLSSEGWSCVKSNVWECGSAGGRLEYEVSGKILLLGRTIPAAANNRVELIVDGGTPRPIVRDGHNLPVATGLRAGRHRVAIVVHPFGGTDKVQISWGGAAGL